LSQKAGPRRFLPLALVFSLNDSKTLTSKVSLCQCWLHTLGRDVAPPKADQPDNDEDKRDGEHEEEAQPTEAAGPGV